MEPDLFLLEMAESDECKSIIYKRLAIRELMGIYFSQKRKIGQIDTFMIPFGEFVKNSIKKYNIDVDELVKYMIDNDESHGAIFAASTWFAPKDGVSWDVYYSAIAKYKILSPYVEEVNLDTVALIVVCFVLDNLVSRKIDISEFVKWEVFEYPTNQYHLTKVNGAVFKLDGLIFDGKGYYYNILTNKTLVNPVDTMVGFARIIHEETKDCDILYRLDERLSMPESEYHVDKLLMIIKQDVDQNTGEDFWHIEIETLPYTKNNTGYVITTFLHGMYFPKIDKFTHIDYTKN